jgi:hypothetical protein
MAYLQVAGHYTITSILSNSNHIVIAMDAPTCSIQYAEGHSKGMDRNIGICGAVIANKIVCEEWPRFSNSRGVVGEVQSGAFEPAMTEPNSLKLRELVIHIVDTTKLFMVTNHRFDRTSRKSDKSINVLV